MEKIVKMACLACGAEKMKRLVVNFKHKSIGLSNVTLEGVTMYKCEDCGEEEVEIPYLVELQKMIATQVIAKSSRLVGEEVRYLRKYLGWSGAAFAKHFGVAPETISRWENDKESIGGAADRLLRFSARFGSPIELYSVEDLLDAIQEEETKPVQLKLKVENNRWAVTYSHH